MSMVSPAAAPPDHGLPTPANAMARVLVIDDSVTILKVVSTILEHNGYFVSAARDGREGLNLLRTTGPYELILLDFVMPRMNGYQFCRELRAGADTKNVPVVLMSARTNAIGERFVQQTGAVDALSKPFDARALVAVVGAVLAKKTESVAKSMPSPDTMVDEEELESIVEAPPASQYFRSISSIAQNLAEALAPHLKKVPIDQLKKAMGRAVDDEMLARLVTELGELDMQNPTEVMRGSTTKMPLAEVLQILQLRRQTGIMIVRHQGQSLVMAIEDGLLQLARASGITHEFRLGRYFVEKGLLKRDEVDALIAEKPEDELFGEWLVARKTIDEQQLTAALAKQSAELVYEVLRWPEGSFVLYDKPLPPEALKAGLGLGLSELALEGFRRVDEWRLMADTVDFNAVLVVDEIALGTVDDSKIGKTERPVLMAIDGKRTVREVMESVEVASFDAIKAIYRFLQSRIIREVKPAPQKGSVHPASKEEEERDDTERDLAKPSPPQKAEQA